MNKSLFIDEKCTQFAGKSKTFRLPRWEFVHGMNNTSFKSFVTILFVITILLASCKKESQPAVAEDPLPNFSLINGFNDTTGFINIARGILGINDALYAKYYKAVLKDTVLQTFMFNIIDLKGRDTID